MSLVEVADKPFKQRSHSSLVLQKAAKLQLAGTLVWNQILEKQPADINQETICMIVSMKEHTLKTAIRDLNVRHFMETTESRPNGISQPRVNAFC
jgi:hypothetical protein